MNEASTQQVPLLERGSTVAKSSQAVVGFRVLGFRVLGFGFGVLCFGFGFQGLGLRGVANGKFQLFGPWSRPLS